MRWSTLRILVSAACVLYPCLLTGCTNKPVVHGAGFSALAVQTQVASLVDIPDASEYLATLKSRRSASINPQVEGWVTKIFVRSGEHVSQGASLMEIDPRVQEATVDSQIAARNAQAANLANADAQYQRGLKLYQAGIISKQDFDTYETTYQSALAQTKSLDAAVTQQRATLHYYTVSAPTDGIVGDIPVHVGDRVTNTTLLTTVDRPGSLEAYLYIPTEHSSDLRLGEPVDLLDDSGNVLARTSVFFVSPEVDSATQTVLAKAIVTNTTGKFRTDEFVNTRITWRTTRGLEVPVLAVQRLNGQFFIFLASNGPKGTVARQQQIQVGDILGNNYVVLSGIKPGDHVIVGGFQFLADGVPVKETVVNAPAAGSR
ncbi:MAG TPA: efflux RND transporter periplasmic adaptor subunit [Candidatus Acidoferrales bacterium]|nr:efflux RND transporter periplasmic adaptor subunit [Candidatus Acidoferrales bacterium]